MSDKALIDEKKVKKVIELVRPALQADGGDIVYNSIDDDGYVHVTLSGACQGCAMATMTLQQGVARVLMDRVPEVKGVIDDTVH